MVLKNHIFYCLLIISATLFSCQGTEKNNETNPPDVYEEPTISQADTGKPAEATKPETAEKIVSEENKEAEKEAEKEKRAEPKKEKVLKPQKVADTEPPLLVQISPPVFKKPKKTVENTCPESMKPFLDFDNKYGILSCEMNPENTSYHYFLVISKNSSFSSSSIVKSFDLGFNSVFPVSTEQKDQLKKIKEYANLYFRYEVFCDKLKYQSQAVGPLSISCRDSGECQIMR